MNNQIGGVSERSGFSKDTLRYYEKIGLLPRIARDASGLRIYDTKDISRLGFIKRAQRMKFSLAEIGQLLEMRENPQNVRVEVRALTQGKLTEIKEHINELTTLRNEMQLLVNLCANADGGPRTLPAPEAWRAPMSEVESCLDETRLEVDSFATALGARATEIFDRAAAELSSDLSIGRAFASVDLRNYTGPYQICWPPRMGASGVGGAEKGYVRTWKHRVFFIDMNFDEGGSAARDTPDGCFGHKKVQLGMLIKEHTLPQVFQFGVYRLGDVLIGSVPVEPTTEVGALIRETILMSAPDGVERAIAVSLANGYSSYVASAEEYEAQHYEGGSTLYGPGTAEMLAYELGRLATSLRSGNPTVAVGAVLAFHMETPSHFWAPRPISADFRREILEGVCGPQGVRIRWTDLRPGTLVPADGPMVQIERERGGQWDLLADDADPEVQIRAIREKGDGYLWEARWAPSAVPAGNYRLRLLAREGLVEAVGSGCRVS